MNADRIASRLLDPVADMDNSTTIDLAQRRKNQTVHGLSCQLTCLANTLFCLSFPCCCCNCCVDVNPAEDVIVSRWDIPTEILREPGSYCCYNPIGLETKRVSMASYVHRITNLKLVDASGTPVYVSANVVYQVVDALAATYITKDRDSFLFEQAKCVLYEVASKSTKNIPNSQLQRALHDRVKQTGIQINSFQITNISFDERLQKIFLAKQEAIAYITGRKVIAEAACDLVKEAVDSLKGKNITLSESEQGALVSDLLYMICNQDATNLQFYK